MSKKESWRGEEEEGEEKGCKRRNKRKDKE